MWTYQYSLFSISVPGCVHTLYVHTYIHKTSLVGGLFAGLLDFPNTKFLSVSMDTMPWL